LSPKSKSRIQMIDLGLLDPHPLNANQMTDELLAKLKANITSSGRYPPLVVRPAPGADSRYQILDGHNRAHVLRQLGNNHAECVVWPCDDRTALLLLATLNRLEGDDVPGLRASLLAELTRLDPEGQLRDLLPESPARVDELLDMLDTDVDAILADLERGVATAQGDTRVISFVVIADDEAAVIEAVDDVASGLSGANRRGRALAVICRSHGGCADA
jgi:ParB-like chromosome segregation protein Spo0J